MATAIAQKADSTDEQQKDEFQWEKAASTEVQKTDVAVSLQVQSLVPTVSSASSASPSARKNTEDDLAFVHKQALKRPLKHAKQGQLATCDFVQET